MPDVLDAPIAPVLDAQADAMEQTIKASLATAMETEAASPDRPIPTRDPATGKFTADPGAASVVVPPVDGAAPEVPEAEAPVIPEGYVAAQPLPEDKRKGFTVKDKDGEILAPDLTWEFEAGGKPRSVDTATLLQYAQHGVYNHEKEQARVQTEQQNQTLSQETQQLKAQAKADLAYFERLMSDPDFLIQNLTRFEQENTPEARQEKERQQLAQEKQTWQLQQMATQADTFINNTLEPAVDTLLGQLTTISREEIAAKLFGVADRYRIQGVLHPDGYEPMGKALVNDILPWAQQVHAQRMLDRQAPVKDAKAEAEKAKADAEALKIKAQKARRQGTANLKPGNGISPGNAAPKQIRTQKDAEDTVIGNALAAMRSG